MLEIYNCKTKNREYGFTFSQRSKTILVNLEDHHRNTMQAKIFGLPIIRKP
jgi:hypothetical protein